MRIIFYAAIVAIAHSTAPYVYSGNYMKLSWHGVDVAPNLDTDSQNACSPAVSSINLLRIPDAAYAVVDVTVQALDLTGACLNIGTKVAKYIRQPGTAFDTVPALSFFMSKTSTAGEYKNWVAGTYNCSGTVALINNGAGADFGWTGLTATGMSACGGVIGVPTDVSNGIGFTSEATTTGWGITATLFTAKKFIAADIIGPFSTAGCTNLTGGAGKNGLHPLVIPLEDAAAAAATHNEYSLATDKPQCTSFSTSGADGSGFIFKTSMASATSGELTIQYTHGAGTVYTTRNNCTMSTTANQNYVMKFTIGMRGNVGFCQQAYQEDGTTGQGKYFKLIPHVGSFGSFPTMPALPVAGSGSSGSGTSAASGLYLSPFMIALFSVIAMMM